MSVLLNSFRSVRLSAKVVSQHHRSLHLHEHCAKCILNDHSVTVQPFVVASTVQQAQHALKHFAADEYVVKAQVLAGGRGKGTFTNGFKGGVHFATTSADVLTLCENMLGQHLVTAQTSQEGALVKQVMIARSVRIHKEAYIAVLLDRERACPVVVACAQGGVDIETVAKEQPDAILKEYVDINTGLSRTQAERLAHQLGFESSVLSQAATEIEHLYKLFIATDATQIEINPFAHTDMPTAICAVDAKLEFDDNAAYRQQAIFALDDPSDTDPLEIEAAQHNMNFINLDGDIGCLVNGAGLAMGTMDAIKLHGGQPANFLDVGGRVDEAAVAKAFQLITSESRVRAILVNIFGGIVNCAVVARGIVNALDHTPITLPLIVRLQGTSSAEATSILAASGHSLVTAIDLDDAAVKAVQASTLPMS